MLHNLQPQFESLDFFLHIFSLQNISAKDFCSILRSQDFSVMGICLSFFTSALKQFEALKLGQRWGMLDLEIFFEAASVFVKESM